MKRLVSYFSYLWRVSAGFRRGALLRTLLGVLRVGASLTFVWLSKATIDCATGRVPAGEGLSLVSLFALMAACMIVDMLLSQGARFIESRAVMRMNNSLSRRLFNILMAMPPVNGRQGFHSGDMLNRLTLDVRTVSSFALAQLPSMLVMLVQLIASFLFLAVLNPGLALAPVIIMPVCLLVGRMFLRRHRRLTAELRSGESNMNVAIQEGLKHRMLLKSLESLGETDRRLGVVQQGLESANRRLTRLSALSGSMTRLGFVLGYLAAFGWGVFGLQAGVVTFGVMTAFMQLVNRIQNPIVSLAGYLPSFVAVSVAIDRLREIDPAPQPGRDAAGRGAHAAASPLPAGVRVSNVSFRYESDGGDVLSRFSHDFTPGSRTLIEGATGAGKSTLIKLLLGLLRPDSGSIELYGPGWSAPASAATLCNFAYVPQGNSLLSGTIRSNLLLAAPEATDEQLAHVLHVAAADFVFDLPAGLDTLCDETGSGLSEGQAQRIAIARALLRPGSVLLLDEFNSALDSATAATLMERLSAHRPDSTVIIIAHHQSVVAPYCTATLRLIAEG